MISGHTHNPSDLITSAEIERDRNVNDEFDRSKRIIQFETTLVDSAGEDILGMVTMTAYQSDRDLFQVPAYVFVKYATSPEPFWIGDQQDEDLREAIRDHIRQTFNSFTNLTVNPK